MACRHGTIRASRALRSNVACHLRRRAAARFGSRALQGQDYRWWNHLTRRERARSDPTRVGGRTPPVQ
jgi:hypothetical protein